VADNGGCGSRRMNGRGCWVWGSRVISELRSVDKMRKMKGGVISHQGFERGDG